MTLSAKYHQQASLTGDNAEARRGFSAYVMDQGPDPPPQTLE